MRKAFNLKEAVSGLMLLTLGALVAWQASAYELGSLRHMGPGFFPLTLGIILSLLGGLTLANGRATEPDAADVGAVPEWRGWACICAGLAAFAGFGAYGGLIPGTFACVFISALGDRRNSWKTALALAACMSVIAGIVFYRLLHVQFPLFQWG